MTVFSTYIFLKEHPFLRVLFPFFSGQLIASVVQQQFCSDGWIIFVIIFISLIINTVKRRCNFYWQVCGGIYLNFVTFATSILFALQNRAEHTSHFRHHTGVEYFHARSILSPQINGTVTTSVLLIDSVYVNDTITAAHGKIYAVFQDVAPTDIPVAGAWYRSIVTPVQPQQLPRNFYFDQYLAQQYIYYQSFIRAADIFQTSSPKFLQNTVLQGQNFIRQLFFKVFSFKHAGFALALLIGNTNYLDKDLQTAYTNTGIAHIIAISGMHMQLIIAFILLLLRSLPALKPVSYIAIWYFAFLAAANPSVIRAAVTASLQLYIPYKAIFPRQFNILFLSAIILLCLQPHWLYHIGFQLSYLAVISILIFYPILKKLFHSPYYLLNQLLQIVAVTLAAQILTLPVCCYYFKQLPLHFLLSNMIAIPLSTSLLYCLILVVAACWNEWLCHLIAQLCVWHLEILNYLVLQISQWNWLLLKDFNFSLLQCFILYAAILLFSIFAPKIRHNRNILWVIVLTVYISWQIADCLHPVPSVLIVYPLQQKTAVEYYTHEKAYFWGDTSLQQHKMIVNTRKYFNIKEQLIHHLTPDSLVSVQIGRHRILINASPMGEVAGEADILISPVEQKNASEKLLQVITQRSLLQAPTGFVYNIYSRGAFVMKLH